MPSTLIRKSSYDPGNQVLSIWLVPDGKRYDYHGVPKDVYDAFRVAFAKGRFFNKHIKGSFPHQLVVEEMTR